MADMHGSGATSNLIDCEKVYGNYGNTLEVDSNLHTFTPLKLIYLLQAIISDLWIIMSNETPNENKHCENFILHDLRTFW